MPQTPCVDTKPVCTNVGRGCLPLLSFSPLHLCALLSYHVRYLIPPLNSPGR